MSVENAKKYFEMLQSDEALLAKLNDGVAAFIQEHPSYAEDHEKVFDAVIAPMCAEAGLPVSYAEAESVVGDGGTQELDLDELDAAAGGKGLCYVIGGSDGEEKRDGIACKYVGVGMGSPGMPL